MEQSDIACRRQPEGRCKAPANRQQSPRAKGLTPEGNCFRVFGEATLWKTLLLSILGVMGFFNRLPGEQRGTRPWLNSGELVYCVAALRQTTLLTMKSYTVRSSSWFVAILVWLIALEITDAQTSVVPPEKAVASLVVRPGFHVELAAAEPLIADPVAAVFDENGRLFVVEYPHYNEDWAKEKSPRRGRVRMLVDEDDDGVFDKATTFVGDLENPMALACWGGGLYVGAAPDLWFFRDNDGDGVAEEKRIAFTGFGQETHRAGYAQLNSFMWGLDNRFHACSNYSGGDVRYAGATDAEKPPVSLRSRGFVFDPRNEAGSYDYESGGGQHGMCFDDWGNQFTCRNSDPVQMYFYDDRRLRGNDYLQAPAPMQSILNTGKYTKLYRLSPDEEWRVIRTKRRLAGEFKGGVEGGGKVSGYFTAATGITVYRGDAWPERYRGSALVGEVSNNLVFRADLKRDGVGFVAERGAEETELGVEFIASKNNAFRPVQFVHAPDGNLLLLDMHRVLIEGAAFLPPDVVAAMEVLGGSGMGRVYRILSDEGEERRATPSMGEMSSVELVKLLAHKNVWHRETASRLLYQRQDPEIEDALRAMVAQQESALGRVHAAWLLRGMKLAVDGEILQLLAEPAAEVRRHGVLLAGERTNESKEITDAVLAKVSDESMSVRYAAAMEWEKIGDHSRSAEAIAESLQRDGDDLWMRAAALSSLRGNAGQVAEILAASPTMIGADGAAAKSVLQALAKQVGEQQLLSEASSSAILAAIEKVAAADASLARSMIGSLLETRQAEVLVKKISAGDGRAPGLLKSMLDSARTVAFSADYTEAQRATAVGRLRLRGLENFQEIAGQLLDSAQPGAVQTAAIDALSGFMDEVVGENILAAWKGLAPTARERALGVLMRRKAWVEKLLGAVESGQVTRADLGATRIAALSAHADATLKERAERVFSAAGFAGREEVVSKYQPALTMAGDPDQGKVVFTATCAACHQVGGVGQAIGAELAGIMDRGADAVLLNILDPNREVHADFLLYSIRLKDGATETGMIRSESSSAIKLRRIDGSEVDLLRVDISKVASLGTSFMPEGLETAITVQQMADLLAWLKEVE
jgi:putative membrane-bound dehydrogenase-like protein